MISASKNNRREIPMTRDHSPVSDSYDTDSCVLLTGATGLLGRYLLRDLLCAGRRVAAVVRQGRRWNAEERIEAAMQTWERTLEQELPRPYVLEGDLQEPGLGFSEDDRAWIAENCSSALHNAASLAFVGADRNGEPWRSNVTGTQSVLDLCRETGIADYHHVSTAYVCGLRQDTIAESDVDVGQELSNDYERSKLEAEQLIRETDAVDRTTVYRPAIIVGDSETGFTTTFHGFYAALRLAYTLRNSVDPSLMEAGNVNLRLTLSGTERKNLVPVDWVSAVMTHVLTHPEYHGRTYHLTPEEPVTTRMIYDALETACNLKGTVVMHGAGTTLENPSEIERLFYDSMQVYNAYWRSDPVFDRSNTRAAAPHLPCPVMDEDRLLMLAKAAIEQSFRWKDKLVSKPSVSASR